MLLYRSLLFLSSAMQHPPSQSSPSWDAVAREYEARVEPFTGSFVGELLGSSFLDPPRGARHRGEGDGDGDELPPADWSMLDVGCGSGAAVVAALGSGSFRRVAACDASPAMVQRARERIDECLRGDDGPGAEVTVECVVADGQDLPESWSGGFDVAVSNFAVIFFPDPLRGLREIRRCLVPGTGRVAISAWGDAKETPAFRIFPDAIDLVGVPPEEGDSAKPKRITGSPDVLQSLLERAGFERVEIVGPVTRTLEVRSAEEYYNRFALTSPPLREMIARIGEEKAAELREKVMELAVERGGGAMPADGAIRIPSSAYFAYGVRPP